MRDGGKAQRGKGGRMEREREKEGINCKRDKCQRREVMREEKD